MDWVIVNSTGLRDGGGAAGFGSREETRVRSHDLPETSWVFVVLCFKSRVNRQDVRTLLA